MGVKKVPKKGTFPTPPEGTSFIADNKLYTSYVFSRQETIDIKNKTSFYHPSVRVKRGGGGGVGEKRKKLRSYYAVLFFLLQVGE